jgi:hypothetical protein
MLIKIEITFLINNNLDINEYLLIEGIKNNTYNTVKNVMLHVDITTVVNSLKQKGWLEDDINTGFFKISKKYEEVFGDSNIIKSFDKIYFTYPQKVFRKFGGFRILRAATKESNEYQKCLNKYIKLVKSQPWLSNVIEKSLIYQLEVVRNNNSLEYLQEFEVWLNNNTWEKYIKTNITTTPIDSGERTGSI